jgi:hypothetical protein
MANNRGHSKLGIEADAIETGKKVAGGLKKGFQDELAKSASAFWRQVLGGDSSEVTEKHTTKTEMPIAEQAAGVVYSRAVHADRAPEPTHAKVRHFEKPKNESRKQPEIRAAIEYHEQFTRSVMDFDRRANERQKGEMNQQIQEIMAELKKLIVSTKELKMQFAGMSVEAAPVEIGTYHVTFFEWMLLVIKQAKQKVDDAGAWLSTMKGKGNKKRGYWDMFKKHGTSFGLSNERAIATQAG